MSQDGSLAVIGRPRRQLGDEVANYIREQIMGGQLQQHLRRSGLVNRAAYPEVPPRVEYSLTGLGTSLLCTVLALASWSADHHAEIRRHQTAFDAATARVQRLRE